MSKNLAMLKNIHKSQKNILYGIDFQKHMWYTFRENVSLRRLFD
jgi:hypothetical protein